MNIRKLSARCQAAWELAVKCPTKENIEEFESIEDEYRAQLSLDRKHKINSRRNSSNNNDMYDY